MIIYAFTGRAQAGLALLDDVANRPLNLKAPSIEAWRAGLVALMSGTRSDIARALDTNLHAARQSPGLAANAIMIFSSLNEIDAAYHVADGLLTNSGPLVLRAKNVPANAEVYSNGTWGRAQFLFIPATGALRADPRFTNLCERMGHTAYWRERRIWPDPFVRGSLKEA